MSFKTYYETVNTKDDVPVKEFMERIPPEIVLELSVNAQIFALALTLTFRFTRLLAADYQESMLLPSSLV